MSKRLTPLAAVAALLALAALVPIPTVHADRQYQLCDPFKSNLCSALVALYEFEEDSDFARTSETGGALFLEPDGVNLARSATYKTKPTGAGSGYSFNHTAAANSSLIIPRTTGFGGTFTGSFWLYVDTLPSADTKVVQIISMKDSLGALGYPYVALYRSGANTNVRFYVKQSVTDTVSYVASSSTVSGSTWTHVSFGMYPTPTTSEPYQMTLWASINAGAKATATVAYPGVPTLGTLTLGAWSNTSPQEYGAYKVDQLAVWSAVLSPEDLTKLYGAGSGKAFPFVD
jgi:hypothetical protein